MAPRSKIKVLYTIPNFDTAGSGIVLYKLLSVIDRNRFEPEIACFHDKGKLFQEVKALGFPIHIYPFTTPMRPVFKGIWQCFRISRFFKKNGYDIIYSYHYHADYSEPLAALMAGIPWIFVKKNMGWFGPNYRAWKLRSLLAKHIVVQNTAMLREFYPESGKVSLISIGVDTNEYFPSARNEEFREKHGFNHHHKIVLSVSSMLPIKGIDLIIDAFGQVANTHPELMLVIVGPDDSEYAQSLKQKSQSLLNLNHRIIFTGKQYNIPAWLNISDLFIQATRDEGRREGAPIALQEAMAAGCLVLGSNMAGIEDQLDIFPELLFEPGNAQDLANKMNKIMSLTSEEIQELKERLQDQIKRKYSLENEKQLHENLLIKFAKKF